MKNYRVVVVDAFTTVPFAGNPCAVLPDADGLTDEEMQAIARETNLPETSFVFPSSKAHFKVRYFTPRSEIPFAGHPTIATSFLLAKEGRIESENGVSTAQVEFNIGVLPVDIHKTDGMVTQVVMTQQPPTFGKQVSVDEAAESLGLERSDLRSDCLPQAVSTGVGFLIVAVSDVRVLQKVQMDRKKLGELCAKAGVGAAYLFALGGFDPKTDLHARFFDPKGTMEDPFTGSAAGAMGSYVVQNGLKSGPVLRIEQGHFAGRPGNGVLEIESPAEKIERVRLGGAAVKVIDGTVTLP